MLILEAINASARLSWAWDVLSSPVALRVWALAIGGLILAGSLVAAIWADRHAERQIKVAEKDFAKNWPGPKPTNPRTIRRRRKYYREIVSRVRWQAFLASGVSFVAGVLVPSALLLAMTLNYTWFDGSGEHLLNALRVPISAVSPREGSIFVLDQTLRGGLFDLLEVFAIDVTLLDNNPANGWFSTGVFAHHLMVEAFVFSGLWLYIKTLRRLSQLEQGVHKLLKPPPPVDSAPANQPTHPAPAASTA